MIEVQRKNDKIILELTKKAEQAEPLSLGLWLSCIPGYYRSNGKEMIFSDSITRSYPDLEVLQKQYLANLSIPARYVAQAVFSSSGHPVFHALDKYSLFETMVGALQTMSPPAKPGKLSIKYSLRKAKSAPNLLVMTIEEGIVERIGDENARFLLPILTGALRREKGKSITIWNLADSYKPSLNFKSIEHAMLHRYTLQHLTETISVDEFKKNLALLNYLSEWFVEQTL